MDKEKREIKPNDIVVLRDIKNKLKQEFSERADNLGMAPSSLHESLKNLKEKRLVSGSSVKPEGNKVLRKYEDSTIKSEASDVVNYLNTDLYNRFTFCCPNCGHAIKFAKNMENIAMQAQDRLIVEQSYGTFTGLPKTGYHTWGAGSL